MQEPIMINLNLSDAQSGKKLMLGDIGYDEYAGTLSTLGYANLSELKNAAKGTFRYIRIHNIFTSKEGDHRGARDAGGDPVRIAQDGSYFYNWTIIDKVLKLILDIGCIPFLELGFTPTPWSSEEEKLSIPKDEIDIDLFWKMKNDAHIPGLYPPKDHTLWKDLLEKFFIHIKEKFGEDSLDWPCELWNEPDIGYFKGTIEEYCNLWKLTYFTCKKMGIKTIGGPGIAHSFSFLNKFLNFAISEKCEPDFISYHVKSGNTKTMVANMDQTWIRILMGRDAIPETLRKLPIWITEYDPIVGCENGIVDGEKWAFHNKSYYASWLGKSCLLYSLIQQRIAWGENTPDEDIEPLEIDAIFNDNHHITAEQYPFFGARCMTTPIWVEKQEEDEVSLDPLKDFKEKHNLRKEQPSLYEMTKDINKRMYVPENPEKFVLKTLAKPIFRAFEYTRFLEGSFIPFSNYNKNIYGVLAHNKNIIYIIMGNHNDEKLLENNIVVEADIKIVIENTLFNELSPKIHKTARIDVESCNPYETWLEMNSPFEVSIEEWNKLYNSTLPKAAIISDFYFNKGEINFRIKMMGNSFNFIQINLK